MSQVVRDVHVAARRAHRNRLHSRRGGGPWTETCTYWNELHSRRGVGPEVRPEVRPEVKPEVTAGVRPEVRPEVGPEVRPEVAGVWLVHGLCVTND